MSEQRSETQTDPRLRIGANGGPPLPQPPYTVREYAKLARLSLNAVYSAIREGDIPAVKFGRAIRIPREAGNRRLNGESA